ncbi:Brp/Blh family beta-carotene 15,15'-dioxygenase [Aquirufa regiilacus]
MKMAFRYSGIFLSLGYLLVISLWKTMPVQVEWGFCLLLLATLGIPHGAADHLLAQKLASQANKTFGIFSFLGKYLLVMLLYGSLWYVSPLLSFLIFIAISVFHFGDLETSGKQNLHLSRIQYYLSLVRSMILGTGILGFILSQNAQEVSRILQNFDLGVVISFDALPVSFYILCILVGYQKDHKTYFIHTAITLLIGTYLPILPAFICYFAGCHAVYSLKVLSTSLEINLTTLYKRLIPFTCLALVMGTIYVGFVSEEKWLAHAFIYLSILTMPHFILMHQITIKKPE